MGIGKPRYFTLEEAFFIAYFSPDSSVCGFPLDIGEPDVAHAIISIAGCRHDGADTVSQVVSRIWNAKELSHCFKKETVRELYRGIRGGGRTRVIEPNKNGLEYFCKVLCNINGEVISRTLLTFDEVYEGIMKDILGGKSSFFRVNNDEKTRRARISLAEFENLIEGRYNRNAELFYRYFKGERKCGKNFYPLAYRLWSRLKEQHGWRYDGQLKECVFKEYVYDVKSLQ